VETENPDEGSLKNAVIKMQWKRLKPRSINSYRTAMSTGSPGQTSPVLLNAHIRLWRKMKDEEKVLQTDEADDVHEFIPYKAQLESMDQAHFSCPCAYRILEFFVLSSEIRNCRPLLHQGYRKT
jgi:hypothetical protein